VPRLLVQTLIVLTMLAPTAWADAIDDRMTKIKQQVRSEFPEVRQIDIDTFKTLTPDAILDVREPEEFDISHIDGARIATDVDRAIEALGTFPTDALIVAYCSVGWRSSRLATALKARGYTNVVNLEGSIFEWANTGNPVFRADQPVKDVHPFSWKWGRYLKPEFRTKKPRAPDTSN